MKNNRLVIGALGQQNSGKSTTWYELFNGVRFTKNGKLTWQRVRATGKPRRLELRPGEWVEVFLINGSPQETTHSVEKTLRGQSCPIVLCSMRYPGDAPQTLDYYIREGFDLYVQWLNPGCHHRNKTLDRSGLQDSIPAVGGQFFIRNGKKDPANRVQEIREHIYKWAKARNLIVS